MDGHETGEKVVEQNWRAVGPGLKSPLVIVYN